jgi:hypothetical protein
VPLDAPTSSADPAATSDESEATGVDRTADGPDGGTGGSGGKAGAGGSGGADDVDRAEGPGGRSAFGRMAILGIVVALVAMWAYVVYLAFGPGRQPPVDRLDDPAFARAAEDRCAAAVADIEELPPAQESPTPQARAEVLEQANGIFTAMLDDLRGLDRLAPRGDQRERVQEWLADWDTYLGDRLRFAEALRDDPQARFLISEKGDTGRHITGWIDEFAKANKMPSCMTPTDV